MEIKFRIWIENNDDVLAGNGRIKLLETIKTEGSISKAAIKMGISYKKAWKLIDSMNNASNKPLIITSTGGVGGGGASLSEEATQLISSFHSIQKSIQKLVNKKNTEIENLLHT